MHHNKKKGKKNETERATALDRETREEIAKWNQITTLRFQTERNTSDILGLPSGHIEQKHVSRIM